MATMKKEMNAPEFQVGDRVELTLGKRTMTGVVVEDRGRIGVGGRRLYRVEVNNPSGYHATFEKPAEQLRLADD